MPERTVWRGRICVKTIHSKRSSTTSFSFSFFPLRCRINKGFTIFLGSINPAPHNLGSFHSQLWYTSRFNHFLECTVFYLRYDSTSVLFGSVYRIVLCKVRAVSHGAFNSRILFPVTFSAAEGPLHCSWSSF